MEEIFKYILGSAGSLACLVIAVKWLDKDRNKLLDSLNEERNGRIALIEESNTQCFEDRKSLNLRIIEISNNHANDREVLHAQMNEALRKSIEDREILHAKIADLRVDLAAVNRHLVSTDKQQAIQMSKLAEKT